MDYQKHYDNLMIKSRERSVLPGVYTEKHHVVPKCINGTNDVLNIVVLFPEEHIIAHLLLAKILFAAYCMVNGLNKCVSKISNNKQYRFIKEKYAKNLSERLKHNNLHKNMTKEQIKERNLKSAKTTRELGLLKGKNHPLYGVGHTKEAKQKISLNHADVSGENNSRAKSWMITSPNGTVYNIKGTLKQFCLTHNVSISMLRNHIGKVITKTYSTNTNSINTVGWKLEAL